MTENPDLPESAPLEPGLEGNPKLGLSDEEAGFPDHAPAVDDDEVGDIEIIEGDGDDLIEED
jgi:hypothetical protein